MAKRSRKKKALDPNVSSLAPSTKIPPWSAWVALLLAAVAFAVYWPSLKSDFVYDARIEIIEEGFITSFSNISAVLSLKVLSMNLTLGARPGQMLYLMLIAVVSGKEPFGYHLCSNLLHAANVALLYIVLCRLIATELTGLNKNGVLKVQLAAAVVTLVFALHPIAVESVAEISYSSSLLVTVFTLLALLAAMAFRPENFRSVMIVGSVGSLCAFAAVASKESGVTTVALLIVYWFLFRRREAKGPWFLFIGAAMAVTVAFLAARFLLAPQGQVSLGYLGGSFFQVFWVQPRIWVFMMAKLLWPVQFSADYTWADIEWPSTPLALAILAVVVSLQGWLAYRSRMGALGVAIYWLGLATVSNFIPLNRPLADRFYYLPLAGVAMQLLALLLMASKSNRGFWMAVVPLFGAMLPLTFLTLTREDVFAGDPSLWADTLQVSPQSSIAHNGVGNVLAQRGEVDEAIVHYQRAVKIDPNFARARSNLGIALVQKGEIDESIIQFQKALESDPNLAEVHNNLGAIFCKKGEMDEAIVQFQKALAINPNAADAHSNLGNILAQKGERDDAIAQYQMALAINPNMAEAHNNLGLTLSQKGQMDEAISHYQKALEINPNSAEPRHNLGIALFKKGQVDEAIAQYQKTLEIDPNCIEAYNSLGIALIQKGQVNEAVAKFQEAIRRKPDYIDAQKNLARAEAMLGQKKNQK